MINEILIDWYYRIRNYLYLRKYKKMNEQSKRIAIAKFYANMPLKKDAAPVMKDLAKIQKQAELVEKNKITDLYFGDSIGDFLRNDLKSIDPIGNFCHAGDTGFGFIEVIDNVFQIIDCNSVRNIVIGTFGNNALQGQVLKNIILELESAYSFLRINCPDAKIIFIGFPPVYDIYANMCAPIVEERMRNLDKNSTVIDLNDFGFLPRVKYSMDGVHLSEYGGRILDRKIKQAKK